MAILIHGQTDTIPAFLKDGSGLRTDQINQARRYLIDKFLATDLDAVKQVVDYMMLYLDDNDYLALYPAEHILLQYWLQDYEDLLWYIQVADTATSPRHRRRLMPQQDNIWDKIREKTIDSHSVLLSCIQNAKLDYDERDFLALFLDYFIKGSDFPNVTQEDLNERSWEFIATYPESRFNSIIKRYIIVEFAPSPFAIMMDFYGGMGVFTASLDESFNNFGCFGFGFGMSYNRFLINLGMALGATTNLLETDYNGIIWSDGSRATIAKLEVATGYQIFKSKRLALTPFLAFGGVEITPVEKDRTSLPELKDAGLKMTSSFSAGIYTDFTLTRNLTYRYHISGPVLIENVWFIRLGYTMLAPGYQRHYGSHDGVIHMIKLGAGLSSCRVVRKVY